VKSTGTLPVVYTVVLRYVTVYGGPDDPLELGIEHAAMEAMTSTRKPRQMVRSTAFVDSFTHSPLGKKRLDCTYGEKALVDGVPGTQGGRARFPLTSPFSVLTFMVQGPEHGHNLLRLQSLVLWQ
jgi:hypothetical protein